MISVDTTVDTNSIRIGAEHMINILKLIYLSDLAALREVQCRIVTVRYNLLLFLESGGFNIWH